MQLHEYLCTKRARIALRADLKNPKFFWFFPDFLQESKGKKLAGG